MRSALAPSVASIEGLLGRSALRGSARWLRARELHYGGITTDVERRRVSPRDPRPAEQIAVGGMIGGDRMSWAHHNYARTYAHHLERYVRSDVPQVVVEVGILKGSGLAIWCDLFPEGTIIGLDVDLSHFDENLPHLRAQGAFMENEPELLTFDAYEPETAPLDRLLDGRRIDIVIDDGPHTIEAITSTAAALQPLLAERFTYFIEDNPHSFGPARSVFGSADAALGSGGLVVIWS